jgi:hypothetical protein
VLEVLLLLVVNFHTLIRLGLFVDKPFHLSALESLVEIATHAVKTSGLPTSAWQGVLNVIAQYQLEFGHFLTEDVVRAWEERQAQAPAGEGV